jgi:hypothetical protein
MAGTDLHDGNSLISTTYHNAIWPHKSLIAAPHEKLRIGNYAKV